MAVFVSEDAEKAKSQVTSLDGRKLYICYANKKKDTKVKKSFTIRKSSGNEESIHAETEKKVQFDGKIYWGRIFLILMNLIHT